MQLELEESKIFIESLMGQLKSNSRESSDLYEQKLLNMTSKLASMEALMTNIKETNQKSCQEKDERIAQLAEEVLSMEALATALKDDKRELTSTIASLEESKRLLSQSLQEQTERSVVLETESSRLRSMEDEKLLLSKAVE